MRVVMFCHSLLSDWNHGNAHFLRGVVTDLLERGHQVEVYEPADAWSLRNLIVEYGQSPLAKFRAAYPALSSIQYDLASLDLDEALDSADLVLVHEWNDPALVDRIGSHHAASGRYLLLFHDTHHRSVTDPTSMALFQLENYDGVLAFGQSVAAQYRRQGGGLRVWVWHEAADHRVFFPRAASHRAGDLVWIGNWGDDERTAELREFLIDPVRKLGLSARVHGVRYPQFAIDELQDAGIQYEGWVPNFEVPDLFARYSMTVHVPRRPYATALCGVPTIRMFEALACGIPLISAPWDDMEQLFTAGKDFLFAQDGADMQRKMRTLLSDRDQATEMASHGRETILKRHTCAHRVTELLDICRTLGAHHAVGNVA
jgi:spore maturation protein CgeB